MKETVIKSYKDLQKHKKQLKKEINKEEKELKEEFDFIETIAHLLKSKKKKKENNTSEPIQEVFAYVISNLGTKLFPRIKNNEKAFSIFTGVAASISYYISKRTNKYFEKIFQEKAEAKTSENQVETKKD